MIGEKLEHLVRIHIEGGMIEGALAIPEKARGVVLFAHGSGSSRHSPRNNFVAEVLYQAGLATLLLDLLTLKEDAMYETRFDIGLLTDRLVLATQWLREEKSTRSLPIGYFGASTGAAAALQAAAIPELGVRAVVSRGGRPDLAGDALPEVQAPTLLIVGGEDDVVIGLNQDACNRMRTEKELVIIPGATHLFEEPGTLEEVARLASQWLTNHLNNA